MDIKAIVLTRQLKDILYDRMIESLHLPFKTIPCKQFTYPLGGFDYLVHCLEYLTEYDWVINIDEDCLILNNDGIINLINYMEKNGYDYCGIPDGGQVTHRNFNPSLFNACFNIFGKRVGGEANTCVLRALNPVLEDFKKVIKLRHTENLKFRYNLHKIQEPYYKFFWWLVSNEFKDLRLSSYEYKRDGYSTIIKNQDEENILIHTWLSRSYDHRPAQKKRIDMIYHDFKLNRIT